MGKKPAFRAEGMAAHLLGVQIEKHSVQHNRLLTLTLPTAARQHLMGGSRPLQPPAGPQRRRLGGLAAGPPPPPQQPCATGLSAAALAPDAAVLRTAASSFRGFGNPQAARPPDPGPPSRPPCPIPVRSAGASLGRPRSLPGPASVPPPGTRPRQGWATPHCGRTPRPARPPWPWPRPQPGRQPPPQARQLRQLPPQQVACRPDPHQRLRPPPRCQVQGALAAAAPGP